MPIVLGFGYIETKYEVNIESEIRQVVQRTFHQTTDGFFSDECVETIRCEARRLAEESRAQYDRKHKAADPPDRYSSFSSSITSDASNIVAILRFFHVNRRHALSPDGVASLQTMRLVHVDSLELELAKRRKSRDDEGAP